MTGKASGNVVSLAMRAAMKTSASRSIRPCGAFTNCAASTPAANKGNASKPLRWALSARRRQPLCRSSQARGSRLS